MDVSEKKSREQQQDSSDHELSSHRNGYAIRRSL
jgi:hypothetical protein